MAGFELSRDARGHWRVRRTDGLVEGLFLDLRSALRFARRENPGAGVTLKSG